MIKYKYALNSIVPSDIKNLERRFAEMAEKGWMLDKVKRDYIRYKRIESAKLKFYVDLFPPATYFTNPTNENEEATDYRQLCEESGWTLAAAHREIHIFYALSESNPVPIHTDLDMQTKIQMKMARNTLFVNFILITFLWICTLFLPGISGATILVSDMVLSTILGMLQLAIGFSFVTFVDVCWYVAAIRAAAQQMPLPTLNYKFSRFRAWVYEVSAIIGLFMGFVVAFAAGIARGEIPWLFPMIVFFAASVGIAMYFICTRIISAKKREKHKNIVMLATGIVFAFAAYLAIAILISIPIVISTNTQRIAHCRHDNITALTLADFGFILPPYQQRSDVRSSIFVPTLYQYWEYHMGQRVETWAYKGRNAWVAQRLYAWYIADFQGLYARRAPGSTGEFRHLSMAEAATFGAEKGIILNWDYRPFQLVLVNDSTVFFFSTRVNERFFDFDELAVTVSEMW